AVRDDERVPRLPRRRWAQHVEALSDEPVLVPLEPTAVDVEIACHVKRAVAGLHPDVGDEAAGPRRRLFRPRDARGQPPHASLQVVQVVLDERALAPRRALTVALA